LSRLCLDILPAAAGELLSTDNIAGRVITAKGFDPEDALLRRALRAQSDRLSNGCTATARSRT
jgi:hypothetical protein